MILSDRLIREAMARGEIIINPLDPACLGTNSYDVHLAKTIGTYVAIVETAAGTKFIDAAVENRVVLHDIPDGGLVLKPGILYLGATVEYTETHKHVPFVDGKSSIGRLGIRIHATAGRGDVGFFGHWTLELDVVQPVKVYAGMPIGQLIYFETGEVDVPYDKKPSAKYNLTRGRQDNPRPVPSSMWKNFPLKETP